MSQTTALTPGAGWASSAIFQLGKGRTLAVPMSVHQAARQKLVNAMNKKGAVGVVLLAGGLQQNQYDTDIELVFRQDSWFNYLFGVKEAGVLGALDLATGHSVLFIPRLPEEYRIWCGEIKPPSAFQASYAVEKVRYLEDLPDWLHSVLGGAGVGGRLHLMAGVNSDSGLSAQAASFEGDEAFHGVVDTSTLYDTLSLCRVTKSDEEVEVMRYAAYVASMAHTE
ncbi:aminopeptidase P, N-terminal domain-containing protein, partial [Ochromonadaceae sp. CCMP2298]